MTKTIRDDLIEILEFNDLRSLQLETNVNGHHHCIGSFDVQHSDISAEMDSREGDYPLDLYIDFGDSPMEGFYIPIDALDDFKIVHSQNKTVRSVILTFKGIDWVLNF